MKPPSRAPDPAAAFRERLRGRPWRILHTGAAPGAWNMAVDLALLQAAAHEEAPPTLRFYGWNPPAVSLGRFQSPEGIHLNYARGRGWDVVRRPTGGRAVLHHLEVTYSVVLSPSAVGGAGVRTSYRVLVDALNVGLASLGIPAVETAATESTKSPEGDSRSRVAGGRLRAVGCPGVHSPGTPNCFALASECDTLAPGGKLVGSAQARHEGALLQHGSILLDAEPEAWAALFGSAGRFVTFRQLLGEAPTPGEVIEAVTGGFRAMHLEMDRGALSPAEEQVARSIGRGAEA